jgi:hypothetical protein
MTTTTLTLRPEIEQLEVRVDNMLALLGVVTRSLVDVRDELHGLKRELRRSSTSNPLPSSR